MHQELFLVKGVQKAIGDTQSAEQGVTSINLMDVNGFALDPVDGWQSSLPGLKAGGVWADSTVSDGRLLVSGADSNVTETMNLHISTGDTLTLFQQITRLHRFIADCRQMWTTFSQIEPVFLQWWALGAPGRQYALVYNIDIAIDYPDVSQGAMADITLSIEREPYWRALPPGANPKVWTFESRKQAYSSGDLGLVTGTTNHLVYDATVHNETTWADNTNPTTNNYIDIAASLIPGDAEALVEMAISATPTAASYNVTDIYIARCTKPLTYPDRIDSDTVYRRNTLNANDASTGTDTTLAADAGSAEGQRAQITFATATNVMRLEWNSNQDVGYTNWAGRYAVFVRARQNGGSANQILMQLYRSGGSGVDDISVTEQVYAELRAGAGATDAWPLTYLGEVTIPPQERVNVSPDGTGLAANSNSPLAFYLYAERTTGAGVLYVSDLIFVPVDEECALLRDDVRIATSSRIAVVDNTGYFAHGGQTPVALVNATSPGTIDRYIELRGQDITLKPGVANRLYFLNTGEISGSDVSDVDCTLAVRLNIIPRWRGVRDV